MIAIATIPRRRYRPGTRPPARRPTVIADRTVRTAAVASPARVPVCHQAKTNPSSARIASGGLAPFIAQPSASAAPIGTITSANQVSPFATSGIASIAATTIAMLSGRMSAHAGPLSLSSQRGMPGARDRDEHRLGGDQERIGDDEFAAHLRDVRGPVRLRRGLDAVQCARTSVNTYRSPARSGPRWTRSGSPTTTWFVTEGAYTGIGTSPRFGIGQRALLVDGVLWDCITLLDDATAEAVGSLDAIAISHPHYYSSMVEWARRVRLPGVAARGRS